MYRTAAPRLTVVRRFLVVVRTAPPRYRTDGSGGGDKSISWPEGNLPGPTLADYETMTVARVLLLLVLFSLHWTGLRGRGTGTKKKMLRVTCGFNTLRHPFRKTHLKRVPEERMRSNGHATGERGFLLHFHFIISPADPSSRQAFTIITLYEPLMSANFTVNQRICATDITCYITEILIYSLSITKQALS